MAKKRKTKRRVTKSKVLVNPKTLGRAVACSMIAEVRGQGGLLKWYDNLVARRGW